MRSSSGRKASLILVMGVAGAGKTTLAREIVRRIGAVYLDNNHVAGAFFPHTRNGRSYEKLRPGFYKALYTITEANLKLGNSVVLDVPHIREVQINEWRVFMRRLAAREGATMAVIRCFCSEEVLRKRMLRRGEKRDRWKLDHWSEFLTEQPIRVCIPFRHLDIDTEKSLSNNIWEAVRYIKERNEVKV